MPLTGGAEKWFSGYVAPGSRIKGDCTLDWDDFSKAYTRHSINVMNSEQIKAAFEGDKLLQHTSVEQCVEVWED